MLTRLPRTRPMIRTLKRVIDVEGYRTVTSDDLLNMSLSDYQDLRREITLRRMEGAPRYLCNECGHPVYAPRNRISGAYWKHFSGAPQDCPWWTGDPSSTDEVSERQFHGQQESPLHHKLKYLVAELLERDGKYSNVVVDEHLIGVNGRRKPDVRADYADRPLAFELQLSTTQLPIILERELFYERERRYLIWLTWDFAPCSLPAVRQAFLDIRTAHNDNLFTLDAETVAESRRRSAFVFRVLWWREGQCLSKLVTLDDLQWPASGLPFAVAPPPPWHVDLKTRWASVPVESDTYYDVRRRQWAELAGRIGLGCLTEFDEETEHLIALVNCLLSLELGRPVASRQKNLAEVMNTFLYAESRHPYARIFEYVAKVTGNGVLLERPSVRQKLHTAKAVAQAGKESPAAHIVRVLFPEWAKRR